MLPQLYALTPVSCNSNAEWAAIRPLLPVPAWLEARWQTGRPLPPTNDRHGPLTHRQWHQVARHARQLPLWERVYVFFRRWRESGLATGSVSVCGECDMSHPLRWCGSCVATVVEVRAGRLVRVRCGRCRRGRRRWASGLCAGRRRWRGDRRRRRSLLGWLLETGWGLRTSRGAMLPASLRAVGETPFKGPPVRDPDRGERVAGPGPP
jgi:hypothetical protein